MNFTKRTKKGRDFLKTISRLRPLWIRQPFIFTWVNKKKPGILDGHPVFC